MSSYKPHDPKTDPSTLIITVWIDGNHVRYAKANGNQGKISLVLPDPINADIRGGMLYIEHKNGSRRVTEVYTLLGERRGRINSM